MRHALGALVRTGWLCNLATTTAAAAAGQLSDQHALPTQTLLTLAESANISRALMAPGVVGHDFDQLYIQYQPIPTIDWPTGVLIRIAASSVNPVDWKLIGTKGPNFPESVVGHSWPITLGFDMSGTVLAVGPGCRLGLQPGDRVWAYLAMLPQQGHGAFLGAYADHVVADESQLGRVPTTLSLLEAATLPLVALAWPSQLHCW